MSEERSSDPFPFLKIHRTVEALAVTVSTSFGISVAEAGWGLLQLWRRCADPREIERLYDRGLRHVILDDACLSRRLIAAFGRDLDHAQLSETGVLEKVAEDSYRVRGTSDFFKIIGESRRLSSIGAKGGKTTAKRGSSSSRAPATAHATAAATAPATAAAAQERREKREEEREKTTTAARSNSEQEDFWEYMEQMRVRHCSSLGISTAPVPPPPLTNSRLNKAATILGLADRVVDGERLSRWMDLGSLHARYLAQPFGRFNEDGTERDVPWATGLFLKDGVLSRLQSDWNKEQAA